MAQTTTSTTVHQIIKYSSWKTSLPAHAGNAEIQWKHHAGEQLRLTLDITTTRNPVTNASGGQSLARYVMKISYLSDEPPETQHASQNTVPEVLLKTLDLSSFSDVRYYGRELPLKAVYKNSTVAFRYLDPLIQSGASVQTYRRFQMTFKSETEAVEFIQSIQLICPCEESRRGQQPVATQVAPSVHPSSPGAPPASQRMETTTQSQRPVALREQPTFSQPRNPPAPKARRKNTMFADPLSSSSLGDHSSSPVNDVLSSQVLLRATPIQRLRPPTSYVESGAMSGMDDTAGGALDIRMDIDGIPSTQHVQDSNLRSSLPSSAASPLSSQPVQAPIDIPAGGNTAGPSRPAIQQGQNDAGDIIPAAGDRAVHRPTSGPILSALREGDSDIYKLSFEELRQMVAEVIREPGFPELVGRVHKMWKEQALLDLQLAPTQR
ncbi:hypothetical protein FRC12_005283 [Ceratobasidium sp. 428]|nr:hypothetical protein FRC12_005283 [Ceratobasidium sp. 428]